MLNFHDFNVQSLVPFFQAHPYSAGIFTYLIVFTEAMAVIGVIIPGMVTMPAIGFLIGSAVIPAGSTFLCAIAGAITGDCLSYLLGIYFRNRIHRIWPFTRWPALLVQSEKFFRNHGGKSVFIGRFVGPTRAMIPMVAGVLKMPIPRFLLAALPSAVIWAVGYMIPGVLLGALSLELPPKIAAEFALWALLVIIGLWVVVWLMQHYFKQIWQMLDYYIMQIWQYCHKHRKLCWITKSLADPKEPNNHQQLTLVIIAIFILSLFLLVLHQVLISGVLIDLSRSIYYLLTSLRSKSSDYIFMLFTLFGDYQVLLIASGMIFLWLLRKKYWYVALHLLSIIILSIGVIGAMKFFIYSPRPGDILYEIHASAFPSAHTALSLALYGFLAVIIARELKNTKRYFAYAISGTLVILIAFSRMYLGAHWFVDILGGILSGLAMVIVVTISYRRRHILHFRAQEFALAVSIIFILVWLGYSMLEFNKQVKEYTLIWPKRVIIFNQLTKHLEKEIPSYRLNRLGRPIEALNLIYVGNLTTIERTLAKNGWESQPVGFDLKNLIKNFAITSAINHLSVFPQLYHNRRMAILFTKKAVQEDVVGVLRLWPSDIDLKDTDASLWIGSIEYHHAAPGVFSLQRLKTKPLFIGATEFLAKHLRKDFHLWKKHYSFDEQPIEMRGLHWDGKLLIIRSKMSY